MRFLSSSLKTPSFDVVCHCVWAKHQTQLDQHSHYQVTSRIVSAHRGVDSYVPLSSAAEPLLKPRGSELSGGLLPNSWNFGPGLA